MPAKAKAKIQTVQPPAQAPVAAPHVPGRFDGLCLVLYELGLVLALATMLLAVLHATLTHHADIDGDIDATHVSAALDGTFSAGRAYPVYRFQEGMREPIGKAVAEPANGNGVVLRYDPKTFLAPMGRSGTVLSTAGRECRVNLGYWNGLSEREQLYVFDGRMQVATLRLTQVGPSESTGQVLVEGLQVPVESLKGKAVSEYSVVTQVAGFDSPLVELLDPLLYVVVVGGYFVLYRRFGGSPFVALLPKAVGSVRPTRATKLGFLTIIGIPAAWLAAQFVLRTVEYLSFRLINDLQHEAVPAALTYGRLQGFLWPLFAVLALTYEAALWKTRTSPFAWVGRRIAFRGGIFGRPARDLTEHVTMFFLQVIIVYTFARTIGGFFLGNLDAAIQACWPHAPHVVLPNSNPVSLDGISRSFQAVGFALTHAPHPLNEDALFSAIEYVIYNACILGCLLGYGYSLIGYAFGRYVRNVDFTVVGWVTNAWCYGPLFGYVVWRIVPPLVGTDPAVTPGLFRTITFVVAAFLNVVYTLSIWNLGTMFGLMTDKGVRKTGFYSVVRHPSYTVEATMFAILSVRELTSIWQWVAISTYFFIYWLRSEREDQFMSASNPEYLPYRERVKYKFVPGLY